MSVRRSLILGILIACLSAGLGVSAYAQFSRNRAKSIQQKLATAARLTEDQASRAFEAFGPVLTAELNEGKPVNVPGLGTFRLVRIPDYMDIRTTRPVTTPAHNVIEFKASTSAVDASNVPNAQPAEVKSSIDFNARCDPNNR